MTIRIAQFVHATHDVVDEAFLREFPEIAAVKADKLETLANALDGAEIFPCLQLASGRLRVREDSGATLSIDLRLADTLMIIVTINNS